MAQLRPHLAEFQSLNADVLVLSFGIGRLARAWLEETGVPFRLLLDPERVAYRAYGLEHSLLRSWGWKVWLRYARLLLKGYRWRGIQGDSGQLGGDFVVDTRGIVRLAHRSQDPTDRPAVEHLVEALKHATGVG